MNGSFNELTANREAWFGILPCDLTQKDLVAPAHFGHHEAQQKAADALQSVWTLAFQDPKLEVD